MMTIDEMLKLTTPNAIREAKDHTLDERYNFIAGALEGAKEGEARQLIDRLNAIHAEKTRRHAKRPKLIEWLILAATAIGVVVGVLALSRMS
jgi:hypothetical protein